MQKGVAALVDGGWSEDDAYRWGTLLLFSGMFATALLDLLVHGVSALAGKNQSVDATTVPEVKGVSGNASQKDFTNMEEGKTVARIDSSSEASDNDANNNQVYPISPSVCCRPVTSSLRLCVNVVKPARNLCHAAGCTGASSAYPRRH